MSPWSALVITVVVGAITYGMRAIAIVGLADREIPLSVQRMLRSVGPAVLAALALNLAAGGAGAGPSMSAAETLSLVGAAAAAWWSRNVVVSLVVGMSVLWIASAVF